MQDAHPGKSRGKAARKVAKLTKPDYFQTISGYRKAPVVSIGRCHARTTRPLDASCSADDGVFKEEKEGECGRKENQE